MADDDIEINKEMGKKIKLIAIRKRNAPRWADIKKYSLKRKNLLTEYQKSIIGIAIGLAGLALLLTNFSHFLPPRKIRVRYSAY